MVYFELSCDPDPDAGAAVELDALGAIEPDAAAAPDEAGTTAAPDDELLLDAAEGELAEEAAEPVELLLHPLIATLPAIAATKNARLYLKVVIVSPRSVAPMRLAEWLCSREMLIYWD